MGRIVPVRAGAAHTLRVRGRRARRYGEGVFGRGDPLLASWPKAGEGSDGGPERGRMTRWPVRRQSEAEVRIRTRGSRLLFSALRSHVARAVTSKNGPHR